MALPLFTESKKQVKDISVGSGGQDSIYTRPALGICLLYSPTKGCPFFSTTFTDFASIALREKLWRRRRRERKGVWEEVVEAERRGKVRLWVEIVVEEGKEVVGEYCVGDGGSRGC